MRRRSWVACITGGRYDFRRNQRRPSGLQMVRFKILLVKLDITEVWHGAALGTDKYVARWIIKQRMWDLHIEVVPCAVDNSIDGPWPAAGHSRNHRMLSTSRASKLIAFPGDKGTNGCVQAALKMGLEVWQWNDDAGDFVRISQ